VYRSPEFPLWRKSPGSKCLSGLNPAGPNVGAGAGAAGKFKWPIAAIVVAAVGSSAHVGGSGYLN